MRSWFMVEMECGAATADRRVRDSVCMRTGPRLWGGGRWDTGYSIAERVNHIAGHPEAVRPLGDARVLPARFTLGIITRAL